MRTRRQAGLTLLELVVVLAILATLGTVMVTQTASLTEEARYEQTTRMLEALRDAVLGREMLAGDDPTAVPPGFVADVGRLPLAGPGLDLSELWDRESTGVPPTAFAVQTVGGDSDLRMACGWRGPYVRRRIGTSDVRDGWGRDFDLLDDAGVAVDAATDSIGAVSFAGSGTGDVFDVVLDDALFVDTTAGVDLTTGDVSVPFSFNVTAGQYAVVRLYGPSDGQAAVLGQVEILGTSGVQSETVSFSSIAVGPKLLRAYQWASQPATTDDLKSATVKSLVRRVTVLHGGATWPELELGDVDG